MPMWGLKPLLLGIAASLAVTGNAVAEETATPAYTLPGDMGGPGSAIRISRGPESVPVSAAPEAAPLPGNTAVRVADILREREIARAAAAAARREAEARAAAQRPVRVVVVTQPWGFYRPVKRHGGFRLVIDKPDFYLSLGNGHPRHPVHPPQHKPKPVTGGFQVTLPE